MMVLGTEMVSVYKNKTPPSPTADIVKGECIDVNDYARDGQQRPYEY